MQNGKDTEQQARAMYELSNNVDIEEVGFCLTDDGRFGCSPDGLMREQERGLELKCPLPKTQVLYLLEGILPWDYKAQVHGSMVVSGYKSWDFMSFCHGLDEFTLTVEWDDDTEVLAEALEKFWKLYQDVRNCPRIASMLAAQQENNKPTMSEEEAGLSVFI